MEFEILAEQIVVNRKNQTELRILFSRRMKYHVTNTFTQVQGSPPLPKKVLDPWTKKMCFNFQTLLLSLVGYMSFYFPLDDFNDRIMVTLTTMLVIATIMSTIQQVTKVVFFVLLVTNVIWIT